MKRFDRMDIAIMMIIAGILGMLIAMWALDPELRQDLRNAFHQHEETR